MAVASVMGGLAALLSLARVEVPFPILTYLKVDPAEVPSFMAYFAAGLGAGVPCALVHFLAIATRGEVLGGSMKLLAVLSNLAGLSLGMRVGGLRTAVLTGALVRILVMDLANLLVMTVLFPEYLMISEYMMRGAGVPVGSPSEALLWTIIIVSIFNAVHALVSGIPAYYMYKAVIRAVPQLGR